MKAVNVQTAYGITAYLGAYPSGVYTPPAYMAVNSAYATITATTSNSVTLTTRVDLAGDTQLVLNPTQTNAETVTFTSVTTSSPYVYTLSANTLNTHNVGEPVVRNVTTNDSLTSFTNELIPDSTANRIALSGYYSLSPTQYILNYFAMGTQLLGPSGATIFWSHVGLTDSAVVATGNLHNTLVSGFSHQLNVDVNVTVNVTLASPS